MVRRYYEKNSRELTLVDKLRLLNAGFHQVNLQLKNPSAIAYEQQQPREQYQPQQQQQQQQPQQRREQYQPQQRQQHLTEQLSLHQQLREQFEQRKRSRRW